ncbi:MAG: helix-turn-helix transcriptional regulator [Spirochaetes bacterium]|nr:helix-turn-helix transcriptional regulator [Spirochaetota bacterium]
MTTPDKPPFDPEKKTTNLFTTGHPKYSEALYEIPGEIVKGTMRVIQFHEDLNIVVIYQRTENTKAIARPNIPEDVLQIAFYLSGHDIRVTIPGLHEPLVGNKGDTMLGAPGTRFEMEFPANQQVHGFSIHVTPAFLAQFIDKDAAPLSPELMQFIKKPGSVVFYDKRKITPAMKLVIHQILNCPYEHSLKHIFLESKVLELIALRLDQMQTGISSPSPVIITPEDKKRIHSAREILLRDMDFPPSLTCLAKQVNVNTNKLKYGFKELFGYSVFAYLREERLNRAKILLEEGSYTVTETANLVGYSNLSHFAYAFKKRFGINPGSLLKRR